MEIKYFQELKRYSSYEINSILGEKFKNHIQELSLKEIYKQDSNGEFYFKYVGLICVEDLIIAVLPKYLEVSTSEINEDNLSRTMRALKRYNRVSIDEQLETLGSQEEKYKFNNMFSIIDFIFKDYIEYNIYENHIKKYELNGEGEINWEYTIETQNTHLSNKRPVYLNYWTNDSESNDGDFIRSLHKHILNLCVDRITKSEIQKITQILEVPEISFIVEEERLGELEYQIKMIDNELKIQYGERKIRLLKAMKLFLNNHNYEADENLLLLGTPTFHTVWEKACGDVLGNEYNNDSQHHKIISEKTKAHWKDLKDYKSSAMRPDIVYKTKDVFYIVDAKYYTEEGIKGLAVQDIAKQYMYHQALENKEEDRKYRNIFISPGNEDKKFSEITMPLFKGKIIYSVIVDGNKLLKSYIDGKREKEEYLLDLCSENL
ncbi:MAG: hypothetical protein B6227_02760 [Fusobacteriia bacterium 4572_74]|nr:MAG: hypothetical protein B6227_02760 [Fusobacteriia bacterium 4572_74]